MYLPVAVFFIVALGSMALETRADDFGPLAWLRLDGNSFDKRKVIEPAFITPDRMLLLPRQAASEKSAKVFDKTKTLAMSEVSDARQRVIQRAQELIGTPYKWGGISEAKGFDCSGLLVYLFRNEAGLELPRTTTSMIDEDFQRVSRHELQPGDAVFFDHNGVGRVSHVGLYIGDNRFIHAPRTGSIIRIDSLDNRYWNRRYFSARRFDVNASNRSRL